MTKGSKLSWGIVIAGIGGLVAWVGWQHPHWALERCQANMRQIADALQVSHEENGHFPPAWSPDDPSISWRVALLPYLGESDVHGRYNTAAAWDDSSNAEILRQRPEAFACPSVGDETHTAYQAVVGFNTAWPYQNEMSVRDFQDGTSNTLHVIENHSPTIPWTSVNDTKWTSVFSAVPGGVHPSRYGDNVILTALADGSVRRISTKIDRGVWQQLLTPQTGRPIAGKTFSEDLSVELAGMLKPSTRQFAVPVSASSLLATKMLPFTDEPISSGENMVYCPTFVLAWRQYVSQVPQRQETGFARRVNRQRFTSKDIRSSDITIVTTANDGPSASCALKKQLPFIAEFERFHNLLTFSTLSGTIDVRSFGVTSDWDRFGKALGQIQVLDYRSPDDFIIRIGNLSGETLLLAKLPEPKSIAEGITQIDDRIATTNVEGDATGVVSGEQLVIPLLEFSLVEDFTGELRHPSQPVGSRLKTATQQIQFRLDETGAVLFSESAVIGENGHYEYKVGERTFIFDKPFLLLLKQSSKSNPYFAAWVANGDFMSVMKTTEPAG